MNEAPWQEIVGGEKEAEGPLEGCRMTSWRSRGWGSSWQESWGAQGRDLGEGVRRVVWREGVAMQSHGALYVVRLGATASYTLPPLD